ncbi:MAG: PspC domain-containing protein [Eubacteriaceae bacterium]
MNQNLTTLMPLIIIFGIPIILILVIKSKTQNSQNSKLYQTNRGYKMLCKSQSNRALAGVCGGIAEHFGWNATIVRLFFLFSGVGLFTYIVLAIVIPDSDSPLL